MAENDKNGFGRPLLENRNAAHSLQARHVISVTLPETHPASEQSHRQMVTGQQTLPYAQLCHGAT